MPTSNPRVNLTLTPEQYDLVSRLARINGKSRAGILMEFFETVIPVLERVVVVAEAAERTQVQAKEGLLESLERAEATIAPHAAAAMGQLDLLVAGAVSGQGASSRTAGKDARAKRSVAGASRSAGAARGPRPVTRGPGRGAEPPGKRRRKGSRS